MPKAGMYGPKWLAHQLQILPAQGDWVVAFSGGGDSLALLHALVHGGADGRPVRAVHIHHGLQADAETWADVCADRCDEWGVSFELIRINAAPRRGDSPEARARELRYAALKQVVGPGEVLLTAHHEDDQAETLLLQLLRGAGPAGLAAMPASSPFGRGFLARPLLSQSRSALRTYLKRMNIDWIEDPSNEDLAPARNYLRHKVMPLIKARWPAAGATLGRAAGLQADCQALMEGLGHDDLVRTVGQWPGTLSVVALSQLSAIRLRNALRVWLADKQLPLPNARRLSVVGNLLRARADGQPRLTWPGAEIRRYRDDLYAGPPLLPHDPLKVIEWDLEAPRQLPGRSTPLLPDELRSNVDRLKSTKVRFTIRFRQGGERIRIEPQGPTRSLKTLFQNAGVPPWLRDRVPLLYADEQLIEVVGYWTCFPDHKL